MSKIIGAMFQHEETGQLQFVDQQQVEWGFERNNKNLTHAYDVYDQKDLIEERDKCKKALEEISLHEPPKKMSFWVQYYGDVVRIARMALR